MIKRGRPKGATAYPETAVCVKCGVFRPKRRGFCDRCRPRNRGAAAKNAANMASASAIASPPTSSLPSSPSSAALPGVKAEDAMAIVKSRAPHVAGKPRYDDRPEATNKQRSSPSSSRRWVDEQVTSESRGVKRQHQAVHTSGETSSAPQAQIRGKRRRTVSAPAAKNNITNTLPIQAAPVDRNRNVDVVSSYAAHGAIVQGKDRKLGDDSASWSFSSFTASPAAHQLALLLPRSDGTAVDVVTLQYLQSASPTATVSSSPSPALASHGSSPTSSPSVMSSAHSLMSLANVSALAASRYPSPSSYSSSSSPASSPPRSFISWSAFSSPESSLSPPSSFVLPLTPSSKPIGVRSQSKAGDLMLPSLGSLALPRPALPRSFYQVQTAAAGLHLESMVAPSAIRPN